MRTQHEDNPPAAPVQSRAVLPGQLPPTQPLPTRREHDAHLVLCGGTRSRRAVGGAVGGNLPPDARVDHDGRIFG